MKEKEMFEDKLGFFPYGTQYHRAPTPLPEEWAGDMEEIARVGYTHIQFRPQWRCHERIREKFCWEDLDELFDLAHKNSLRVVLKPMLENAPDWVYDELGGARIGFDGAPIAPTANAAFYVGGWLPCFDNPQVMEAASVFVCKMVERYRNHPALWFYNAWNEPRSRPLGQCQCSHSLDLYRGWLKEKFGTIENLNNEYGKAWSSFNTLRAPNGAEDYAEMHLWRQWATCAVADQVAVIHDVIKDAHPEAFVMAHVGCCSVIQDAAADASDDVAVAEKLDRYGTSFPIDLHPVTPLKHSMPDLVSDWLRRVDPSYWCHEFYPNRGCWSTPPVPENLKRLIWMAIAGGTSGFTFWQYRSERFGNETNGFGMREINGKPNRRSEVCDSIAKVLRKHGKILAASSRSTSGVALLYCRKSDLVSRIKGLPDNFDLPREKSKTIYPYKNSLAGSHCLYNSLGVSTDFVIPGDDLTGIKLLHVAGAEIVEQETADWLKMFVEQGGTLVVEYPFACREANTWVCPERPGAGLDVLLGCVEHERVTADGLRPLSANFPGDISIRASEWRIDLLPTTGEIFAEWEDGKVAAVKHKFGKGSVYTFALSPSLDVGENWQGPAFKIWQNCISPLIPGIATNDSPLWIRRRNFDGGEIWFIFNPLDEKYSVKLPCNKIEEWDSCKSVQHGTEIHIDPEGCWIGTLRDLI